MPKLSDKKPNSEVKNFEVLEDCRKFTRYDKKVEDCEKYLYRLNLKYMVAGSIVVFATNLFWFVFDTVKGVGYAKYHDLSTVAIMVMICASIAMLALTQYKQVGDKVIRYSMFAYYLLLIAEVTILMINRDANIYAILKEYIPEEKLSEAYGYVGISIASLYLFAPALTPSPKKIDGIMFYAAIAVNLLIPAILQKGSLYGFFSEVILRIGVISVYINQRNHAMRIGRQNIKLNLANDKLESMAYVDVLTGTFNRRALIEYAKRIDADKEVRTFGVILIDVDDFKSYNDTHSHVKGDDALAAVSGAINGVLFKRGLSLFRYGGEEFLILLPDCDEKTLLDIAKEVRRVVKGLKIKRDDGKRQYLTITCGVANEAATMDNVNELYFITAADKQMYVGKNKGKDCVAFGGEIVDR